MRLAEDNTHEILAAVRPYTVIAELRHLRSEGTWTDERPEWADQINDQIAGYNGKGRDEYDYHYVEKQLLAWLADQVWEDH